MGLLNILSDVRGYFYVFVAIALFILAITWLVGGEKAQAGIKAHLYQIVGACIIGTLCVELANYFVGKFQF